MAVRTVPNEALLPGALARALRHGHSIYDCLYLEAAARTGHPLVTDDRRLARLAERCQVIVVTHLAQVAAFADRHFVVAKADDGTVTTSGVRLVEDDDRVEVLARMMGGLESSDSSLAHARELLASADR